MRRKGMTAAVGLATAALVAVASQAQAAERWTNARWWTPQGFAAGDRCVDQGRFVARCPKDAPVRDLGVAWAIPALGEAHNHNLDAPPPEARKGALGHLAQGVLYVKNPNSRLETTAAARTALGTDTVDALFSLGGLTGPKGHPGRLYGFLSRFVAGGQRSGDTFEGDAFYTVRSPADVAPAVARLKAGGADFVKVYLLGSEHHAKRLADPRHDGTRGVDSAYVPAIVREAARRGMKVTAHVETAADFRAAIKAGVAEIAHLPGYHWEAGADAAAYRLTEADAKLAARRKVVVVTTTVLSRNFPGTPERKAAVRALQVENLRRLHAAGATLAIGSDDFSGGAAGEIANLRELKAFDDATLLRLWIDTPKAAIFPHRRIGRLEPGYEANVALLAADPTSSLEPTRAPRAVFKAGREVWRAPGA
ncbi:MAG TPA: amidohydrolase family protein [Caulobacteraceae bacterium]|nr:amidohydrolase family protein [Caulobacteraceae bacterium]